MPKSKRAMFSISELHQACVEVENLERSIEHYQGLLGIGPWQVYEFDDSVISDMTYHGKPARHKFRAALTTVGPMQLELIQPVEGNTTYGDFLKQHGEGLHHLGLVPVENLEEALQMWEKEGCPSLQSGRIKSGAFAGARYAYVGTVKLLGTILELVERPKETPSL